MRTGGAIRSHDYASISSHKASGAAIRRDRCWRAAAEIDRGAEAYFAIPPQPVSAMFDHLFAEIPASLAAQRAQAIAEVAHDG